MASVMKIKYIAAIFVYFATFTLSVLIVGLPASKMRLAENRSCRERFSAVDPTETELQTRLRKFLEADHQTGIELANDRARLSQSKDRITAERIATSILVEKMRKVSCDDLPVDFCRAWEEHRGAWIWLSDFQYANNPKELRAQQNLQILMNKNISRTYHNMLEAAQRYGVDFKY